MRRRAPDERIEAFRRRVHAPVGENLRRRLAGWATTILDEATDARPEMPIGVEDRAADMWEHFSPSPTLPAANGQDARGLAAVALVAVARDIEPSLNLRLLDDLRAMFENMTRSPPRQFWPNYVPSKTRHGMT